MFQKVRNTRSADAEWINERWSNAVEIFAISVSANVPYDKKHEN